MIGEVKLVKEEILLGDLIFTLCKAMVLVTPGICFWVVWRLYGEEEPRRKVISAYRDFRGFLLKRQRESNGYRRLEGWLLRNGATFHYGNRMTAARFIALRFVLAGIGAVVLLKISLPVAAFCGAVLYCLPGRMLVYLNKIDNERLLPEIKLVYNALELQIRAGVYVTDALAECYGSVHERRLRMALLDLAGDIVMRGDVYDALEKFQCKFDNAYIDTLCITILQALESGQAVELLSDIGEQIRDMEQSVLERRRAALDRSLTFYQLGILTVVLGIALYACLNHMMGAAVRF